MSKKKKAALVPRLRFPEFCETGGWQICTLDDLAYRITTRNQETMITRVLTNSAVDGVVDQNDYFDREVANQKNLDNYFVLDEGDYVYNPRISTTAPVGPISKNKVGKGVMSPIYLVFRFKNTNNDFYQQYFKTNFWHSYLKNLSNTGARHDRLSISSDIFMKMPIPYHLEDEQQKIADCLSPLDDLINAEDKKLALLKAHKKGLLQKLFPAEGKTVPKLRFPEFKNTTGWKKSDLGTIFNNRQEINFVFLTLMSLTDEYGIIPQKDSNKKDNSNYDKSKYLRICVGDVVYNTMRMWQGRCACSNAEGIVSPAYTVCTPQNKNNGLFFCYYFKTSNMIKKFHANSQGLVNDTLSLKYDAFSKISIMHPSDKEQQKISDCLSSLDNFIIAQSKKIETLKTHKSGLMQGLFPSVGEVDR